MGNGAPAAVSSWQDATSSQRQLLPTERLRAVSCPCDHHIWDHSAAPSGAVPFSGVCLRGGNCPVIETLSVSDEVGCFDDRNARIRKWKSEPGRAGLTRA